MFLLVGIIHLKNLIENAVLHSSKETLFYAFNLFPALELSDLDTEICY